MKEFTCPRCGSHFYRLIEDDRVVICAEKQWCNWRGRAEVVWPKADTLPPPPEPPARPHPVESFEEELERLINKFSKEKPSNTLDFILARYLHDCLNAFNFAIQNEIQVRAQALESAPPGSCH